MFHVCIFNVLITVLFRTRCLFWWCQGDILKTGATLQAMRINEVGQFNKANITRINIKAPLDHSSLLDSFLLRIYVLLM